MDIQLPSTVYWACACSVYTPWYTVPPLSYMHGLFLSPRVCSLGFVLYQHHIILIAITLYFILSVESSPLTLPFSEMSCFFWSFSAYEFYSLLVELYTHTHRYTHVYLLQFYWNCIFFSGSFRGKFAFLWKQNLHTVKYTEPKCTVQWILTKPYTCATNTSNKM